MGAKRAATLPQAAILAVAGTLRDAGIDLEGQEATGGEVSYPRARMVNEVQKSRTAEVRQKHVPLLIFEGLCP